METRYSNFIHKYKKYSLFTVFQYCPKYILLTEIERVKNKRIYKMFRDLIYQSKNESENLFINKIITLSYNKLSVYSLCFSPCEKYLASGSNDGSVSIIRLFNSDKNTQVNKFGSELCKIIPKMGSINAVCYSPYGRYLAICGFEKAVKIYDLENYNIDQQDLKKVHTLDTPNSFIKPYSPYKLFLESYEHIEFIHIITVFLNTILILKSLSILWKHKSFSKQPDANKVEFSAFSRL